MINETRDSLGRVLCCHGRPMDCSECGEEYAAELNRPQQPKRIIVDRDADVRIEMRAYLDTLVITGDNIGDIRRSLFVPWDSQWNGWVRDETASREGRA